MKKFNYKGNGILAFSYQQNDYVVHQDGPHNLPEDCSLVKSLVSQNLLVEVIDKQISTRSTGISSKKTT